RGGCRFVDDALDFQAGDLAGILSGLALTVVEISRNGDNCFTHLTAEETFGVGFQLPENHGADLFGAVLLITHLDLDAVTALHDLVAHEFEIALDFFIAEIAADQAFDFIDRVLGVGHLLATSHLPDQPFTVLIDGYDTGGSASSLAVGNNLRLAALHNGHCRVSGA